MKVLKRIVSIETSWFGHLDLKWYIFTHQMPVAIFISIWQRLMCIFSLGPRQLILKFKGSNVIPGRQQSISRVDNMDMVDIDMVDMDMVDMDMVDMDMVDMDREAILRNRSHRNFNFKRPYLETGRSTWKVEENKLQLFFDFRRR